MPRTIANVQTDFALNSGYKKTIIWDSLAADQADILKTKIQHLIPDSPENQRKIKYMRDNLFSNTWAQRKYTNGNLLSSIIYVMVAEEQPEYVENASRAKYATRFSCHPVMRTRKCTNEDNSDSCCMIFIDEVGRVYQSWKSYVKENVLPKGYMVAPTYGVYTFDEQDTVELLCCKTPASKTISRVLNIGDKTAGIGGFAAAVVPLAALALPVAAPLAAGSAVVGLCAAAYSTARSGFQLSNRSEHEQSISPLDRSARGSWIGVMGGMVSFSALGATKYLTRVAAAGKEISLVTKCVVNGMNVTSIIISGTGVASGVVDIFLKWNDNEPVSSLDFLQIAASMVLFTHSVSNFQLASSIANQTRNSTIQNYRSELSNRQRKMFDKMSKETLRIRGEGNGKIDIIRSVNEIPDTQYLNDFNKINKQLNQKNMRPSFGQDGKILLNNEPVDSGAVRQSVQNNIGKNILGQGAQDIPEPFTSQRISNEVFAATTVTRKNCITSSALLLASEYGTRFVQMISNSQSLADVIQKMRVFFSENAVRFLLQLVNKFIDNSLDRINQILHTVISTEKILWRLYKHCTEKYTTFNITFLEERANDILRSVEEYFLALSTTDRTQPRTKCPNCVGFYTLTKL